jgi:hypothetical protein
VSGEAGRPRKKQKTGQQTDFHPADFYEQLIAAFPRKKKIIKALHFLMPENSGYERDDRRGAKVRSAVPPPGGGQFLLTIFLQIAKIGVQSTPRTIRPLHWRANLFLMTTKTQRREEQVELYSEKRALSGSGRSYWQIAVYSLDRIDEIKK